MAECLLLKSGGQAKKLPILNASYPEDQIVWGDGGSATFEVKIATPGVPAEYTYHWYRNGTLASWATGPTCTFYNLSQTATYSVYCVVSNEAGDVQSRTATLTVKNPNLVYTYTGESEKVDDGDGNWHINLNSSGKLNITSLGKWDGKTDLFVLGAGGAGVNTNGAAPGGGGYYQTVNSVYLREGLDFSAIIGAGATTAGASGGTSSMAGTTVNGGGGATGGTAQYYKDCKIQNSSGTGGNVYYYNKLSSTGEFLGNGVKTVNLKYPAETNTTTSGVSVTRAADGGWYSGTVTYWGTLVYSAGTAGVGAEQTQVFGSGDAVSGPGGTDNASRPGQGGGSSGIQGGNGMAVLRNGRSTAISITAQPQDLIVDGNESAVFTITANGTGLTYQWQRLSNANATWTNTTVTGYNTNQLTVNKYSYSDGVQYRCIVTDSTGYQIISAPALLTVQS